MKRTAGLFLLALALNQAAGLFAQARTSDRPWAYQEIDGSLLFFDPSAQALRTWMKGTGWLGSQTLQLPQPNKGQAPAREAARSGASPLTDYDSAGALLYGLPRRPRARMEAPRETPDSTAAREARPERWLVDAYGRTWLTCEGQLLVLSRQGKPELTFPLAAPIQDLAVGSNGVYLLYRTLKPFVEKRDLRSGEVLWTYGDRSLLKEARTQPLLVPLNRMALGMDGALYLAEGSSMILTVLDPELGPRKPGQTFFTCQDAIPARANLGHLGRGPILAWTGRKVLFSVFPPSQVKSCSAPESKGLILARFDLEKSLLEWLPTSIPEDHQFVGLLEQEAAFLSPLGQVAFAPIQ